MNIAGVDCNKSKIAVARLDIITGKLVVMSYTNQHENRSAQLSMLATGAEELLLGVDMAFIEEAPIGRGIRSSLAVSQTTGAVATVCSYKAYFVPVKTWKKHVIGNGNASKSSVSDWLNAAHVTYAAQCDGDQDLIDATCIALYGARIQAVARGLDGH